MTSPSSLPPKDPTFRNYSSSNAQAYAQHRGRYPDELYRFIFRRHEQTGGAFGQLLDIGCGPGNATRDLASSFDHATGCDAGAQMLALAQKLGGQTKSGNPIEWRLSESENCAASSGLGAGQVDLLTACMAAHWFEMPLFWKQAAQLVKPGGSVVIMTRCFYNCHPSNPHATEVQAVFDDFESAGGLSQYMLPGQDLIRGFYDDMPLPWQAPDGPTEFPESKFERYTFNRNGALDGPDGKDFFGGSKDFTFEQMANLLTTSSLYTRWKAEHPDEAGTETDPSKMFLKKIKAAAQGNGPLRLGGTYALLFFKRI